MSLLEKIQNLPVWQRKIILWFVLIILGLMLFTFNILNFGKRVETLEKDKILKRFQSPSSDKGSEIPNISEELKKATDLLKEKQTQSTSSENTATSSEFEISTTTPDKADD